MTMSCLFITFLSGPTSLSMLVYKAVFPGKYLDICDLCTFIHFIWAILPLWLSFFIKYWIVISYFNCNFKKSLAGSRVCLVCFSRFLVIWACKFHCLQDCFTFSFDGTQTVVVALGKTQTNNNQNFRACTNNS